MVMMATISRHEASEELQTIFHTDFNPRPIMRELKPAPWLFPFLLHVFLHEFFVLVAQTMPMDTYPEVYKHVV